MVICCHINFTDCQISWNNNHKFIILLIVVMNKDCLLIVVVNKDCCLNRPALRKLLQFAVGDRSESTKCLKVFAPKGVPSFFLALQFFGEFFASKG